MPFTLAHPAAVLPIGRRLPRATVLSALVVGSMTPDLGYFIPLEVSRGSSHTVAALVTFCLPMGFAIYLVFHLLLKRPLVALLPARIARRLAAGLERALPPRSGALVALSLVLGGATHIAWDSVTHRDGQAVARMPVLRETLFSIGWFEVAPFTILWYLSTVAGLAAVAFAVRRALREATPGAARVLPRPVAFLVLLTLALVPAAAGMSAAHALLGPHWDLPWHQGFAFTMVVRALRTFTAVLAIYALAWHAWHAVSSRAAESA